MKTLELTDDESKTLRALLDQAGDCLRGYAIAEGDEHAGKLADGCDHWLEIVECL